MKEPKVITNMIGAQRKKGKLTYIPWPQII